METSRMPDRLNYSTKAKQLLEKIDERNYMGLGLKVTSRSKLFLFAMALGVESETRTAVQNPYPGGLVNDSAIDDKTIASIYAQFISLLKDPENDLDALAGKGEVYKMAEQYANTGFQYIADYLETKKQEDLLWDLFLELDDQYEAIKHADIYVQENDLRYAKVAENEYERPGV